MKSLSVAVLSLFAGAALAAPVSISASMIDTRQMAFLQVLHDNMDALQLSPDEKDLFNKFMEGISNGEAVVSVPDDQSDMMKRADSPVAAVNPVLAAANSVGPDTAAEIASDGQGALKSGVGQILNGVGRTVSGLSSGLTGGSGACNTNRKGLFGKGLLGGILIPGLL